MSNAEKQCKCESCKRTPQFDSLAAKATPEEKEALYWLWAEMEGTCIDLVFAKQRYDERVARRRQISRALRARLSERDSALAAKDAELATERSCRLVNTQELIRADGLIGDLRNQLAAANEQINRLRAWKESAMSVLGEWDDVYTACGSPGQLGSSKAKAVRDKIAQLQQQNAEQAKDIERLSAENQRFKAERNHSLDREFLGKLVRMTWIDWASKQLAPKPSWLTPWEELDEPSKEVDRQIGEAVAGICVSPHLLLAEQANVTLKARVEVLEGAIGSGIDILPRIIRQLVDLKAALANHGIRFFAVCGSMMGQGQDEVIKASEIAAQMREALNPQQETPSA